MLKIDVDQTARAVLLEPEGHLSRQDFVSLTRQVDPLITKFGNLNGLLIHARQFPGWDSFAAFVAHMQFVNGHHKYIKKIALCTDSFFGNLVEKLAGHFVSAEIRVFPYNELSLAKQWLETTC